MGSLDFEVRGGIVTLTPADVRSRVLPHLRKPEARATLLSILERADEARAWELGIPGDPEAEEELLAQIVRAGGPAVTRDGKPVRMYTVDVPSDKAHERETFRYWSDTQPEVGDVIEAEGVALTVENVLHSPDSVLLECSRVLESAD